MRTNKAIAAASAALVMSALAAGPASASVTLSAAGGGRAASATFDDSVAGFLTITLTNTSMLDVTAPTFVLTALFFDLPGATLAPLTAVIAAGSASYDLTGQPPGPFTGVLVDPAGTNVGGEWAYGSGLVGAPAAQGISSAGFGVFSDPNFCNGGSFPSANCPNLDPPDALNGVNYGITSAGDDVNTGNGDILNGGPLIKNSAVFRLSYTGDLDLAGLTSVSFQYGTALTEPNLGVPIPAAAWLLLSGLGGLGLIGRRRKIAA